mgnify:CR=1 FL=1
MHKFVIERNVPGAGAMSDSEWLKAAENSNRVATEMNGDVQWLESFVTNDKIFCVYIARDEDSVREHARRAGLPADKVSMVTRVIDPTTADATATPAARRPASETSLRQ